MEENACTDHDQRRSPVAWMQVMTDFSGSPAERPCGFQRLAVRISGVVDAVSLVLANEYGAEALRLEYVDVRVGDVTVPVTFGGRRSYGVPAGKAIETDAVALPVPVLDELVLEFTPAAGQRAVSMGSSIDWTMVRVEGAPAGEPQYYYGLQAVIAHGTTRCPVCFFGDSLTNQGWFTGEVSRMLYASRGDVVACNCGISGNRLLHDGSGDSLWVPSFGRAGVERFMRDVTLDGRMVPAVVFALMGVNDLYQAGGTAPIGELPHADDVVEGLKALRVQSERAGVRLLLGTITPFRGAISHEMPAWTPEKERIRGEVNAWLRRQSEVVDVDGLVRSEGDPSRLDARFDCGDHLHLSQQGGIEVARLVYDAVVRELMKADTEESRGYGN